MNGDTTRSSAEWRDYFETIRRSVIHGLLSLAVFVCIYFNNIQSAYPPDCSSLHRLFKLPMIWQPYRWHIIGYDIRAGQYSYTPAQLWTSVSTHLGPSEFVAESNLLLSLSGFVRPHPIGYAIWTPSVEIILFSVLLYPAIGLTQANLSRWSQGSSESESPEDEELSYTDHQNGPLTTGKNDDQKSANRSCSSRIDRRAYVYARQSQTDEDKSRSIQTQKEAGATAAEKEGHDKPRFFVDKNESGFSFERDGFQDLVEAVSRNPAPISLDRVDRLGRDTLETVFVAAKLHYDYEITIMTEKHGPYDLDKIDDQLDLLMNAIVAGKSVQNRIRAAWESIRLRFSDERRWYSWFDKIPLGFQPDNEEWIESSPKAEKVITALAEDLIELESYVDTVDLLKRTAQNEPIDKAKEPDSNLALASVDGAAVQQTFEASDYELEEFDQGKLKRLLTNSVLTGEVRYPRSKPPKEQTVIDEPELQIIDTELFEQVNECIERIQGKYSTGENTVTVPTLADHGMLMLAIEHVDPIKPVCPECNRGMVKNRQDNENPLPDGRIAHYWMCPKYNEEHESPDCQRKIPYQQEWNAIQNDLEDEFTDSSDIVLLKICPPEN